LLYTKVMEAATSSISPVATQASGVYVEQVLDVRKTEWSIVAWSHDQSSRKEIEHRKF